MYDTKYCKVEYLKEKNAIFYQWKAFCKSDDYRNPFRYGAKLIEKYQPTIWITDTTNGFENEEADTKWLSNEFIPKMIDSSIERVVFIIKSNSSLMDEIMGQKEVLEEFFEVELVEKLDNVIIKKYFNNKHLLSLIIKDFKINYHGAHGISHWLRVYRNTQFLAKHYGIKSDVFELFALLHDSKRENEYHDPAHGLRASIFVQELLNNGLISLSNDERDKLIFACKNHTLHPLADDLIVQICFDSDRLDLGRVGMKINTDYLSTEYARSLVEDGVFVL